MCVNVFIYILNAIPEDYCIFLVGKNNYFLDTIFCFNIIMVLRKEISTIHLELYNQNYDDYKFTYIINFYCD